MAEACLVGGWGWGMVVVVNFQDYLLSVGVEEAFLVAEGRVQRRNLVLSFLPGNPDPLIPRALDPVFGPV